MGHILIVDDSRTVRLFLRDMLAPIVQDVEIHEASTPDEAFETFKRVRPDLVFLDLVLTADDPGGPQGSGPKLLARMLDHEPRTRVIVVSSLPDDHPSALHATGIGAVAYVRKPLDPARLRAAVRAALG